MPVNGGACTGLCRSAGTIVELTVCSCSILHRSADRSAGSVRRRSARTKRQSRSKCTQYVVDNTTRPTELVAVVSYNDLVRGRRTVAYISGARCLRDAYATNVTYYRCTWTRL